MTVSVKVLVQPVLLTTGQTYHYTTPVSTRTIIDKATVTNTGASTASFAVNLPESGDSIGLLNLVIDDRAVVVGETYLCPELIGQVLGPGDRIGTTASAASVLSLRISGREVT